MNENKFITSFWVKFFTFLSFVAFGVTLFYNPLEKLNYYAIGFGIVMCLLFGSIYKKFLRFLLGLFNPSLKKEKGKVSIKYAVNYGMLFIVPFAVSSLLGVFVLNWSIGNSFFSTGIMAIGTASSIEIGKLKGKQQLKNTIIASGLSFIFTFILTMTIRYIVIVPEYIEGISKFVISYVSSKGGI